MKEKLHVILEEIRSLGFEAQYQTTRTEHVENIAADSSLGKGRRFYSDDFADLCEREFDRVLRQVRSIPELEGIANRRRWLHFDCKRWKPWQIAAIKNRKLELEHGDNQRKDRQKRDRPGHR